MNMINISIKEKELTILCESNVARVWFRLPASTRDAELESSEVYQMRTIHVSTSIAVAFFIN